MKNNSQAGLPAGQAGLVKLIILIVVIVIILSYFGINLQRIAESETGRANFGYLWQIVLKIGNWLSNLYQQYLAGSLGSFWETIMSFLGKV